MDIVLEHQQIWKFLLTKLIKFSVNGKRILCWSVFAIKPKADFCSFLGYWPSKNTSCAHGIKGEFVSLLKPVVLCTIAIESIADFFSILRLLIFKELALWPWYEGWICFSCKIYRIWYRWKKNFMLINNCNRTRIWS